MAKFGLLHDYLQQRGIAQAGNTFRPGKIKASQLALAHCEHYINAFATGALDAQEQRRLGLPWSEGLVRRTFVSPSGTLLAAHLALREGVACHLAGGTHHAHWDFASGFCVFNDLAVTTRVLLEQGLAKRVLVFDLDVHQGDGTARILADVQGSFTCSIHCEKNFPVRKARSDLDVNLPVGMTDDAYLQLVGETLERLLRDYQPDFILYDAGVDIFAGDPLGRLDISLPGIAARDALVLQMARDRGIAIATVIGGGYDKDQAAVARRHAICVEQAHRLFG